MRKSRKRFCAENGDATATHLDQAALLKPIERTGNHFTHGAETLGDLLVRQNQLDRDAGVSANAARPRFGEQKSRKTAPAIC